MANKLVERIPLHLSVNYSITVVTRSLPVIGYVLFFFRLSDAGYFSLCHSGMLLCGAAQSSSLVDVLVLYVFFHRILLCSLANVCLRKTSIWKVTTWTHKAFEHGHFHRCSSRMDCTEAQFTFMLTHIISAIAPGFWAKTVSVEKGTQDWLETFLFFLADQMPILGVEFRVLVAVSVLGSTIWSSANNLYTVSKGGCGRQYSSVAVSSFIPERFVMYLVCLICRKPVLFFPGGPSVFWFSWRILPRIIRYLMLCSKTPLCICCAMELCSPKSPTDWSFVFEPTLSWVLLFSSTQIAHMSKSSLNRWDSAYIGPLAVCINQYFNFWIGEHLFLWFFLVSHFHSTKLRFRSESETLSLLRLRSRFRWLFQGLPSAFCSSKERNMKISAPTLDRLICISVYRRSRWLGSNRFHQCCGFLHSDGSPGIVLITSMMYV